MMTMTDEEKDARDEMKAITTSLARVRKTVWVGVSLQVIVAMAAGYAHALASSFQTNELGLALNLAFGVVAVAVTVYMVGMVLDFALRTGFAYGRSAAFHEMPPDVQQVMLTARIEATAKRLDGWKEGRHERRLG